MSHIKGANSEVNDSFEHLVGERQHCQGNGNPSAFAVWRLITKVRCSLLDREIAGPGQQGFRDIGARMVVLDKPN
jgi:hypothetical protein